MGGTDERSIHSSQHPEVTRHDEVPAALASRGQRTLEGVVTRIFASTGTRIFFDKEEPKLFLFDMHLYLSYSLCSSTATDEG